MNIRILKKLSLLSSLVIIFCSLTSCKNTFGNMDDSEKIPDWCTVVSFSEHNFSRKAAGSEGPQNFYIPDSSFGQEDITEYELIGNYTGTVDYSNEDDSEKYITVNQTFDSYNDLLSYTQTLALGKWNFTLNARITIGNEKVTVLTSTEEIEFTKDDHSVTFNLESVKGATGSVVANIQIPVNYSTSAKYQISKITEENKLEVVKNTAAFVCNNETSNETLTFEDDIELSSGSYILLIQLYSDSNLTDSKYIAFTVEAFCETTIDRVYEEKELNKNYSIQFSDCAAYTDTYYFSQQDNVTLPSLTKTGYNFLGWAENDEETDSSKIFTGWTAGTQKKDFILYAIWKPITYTITYDLQKGSYSSGTNPTNYTMEDEVTLISPERKYFDFDGWYDGDNKVGKIEKGTTGDITLTAKWNVASGIITVGEITFPTYSSEDVTITADTTQADEITAGIDSQESDSTIVWFFGGNIINGQTSENFTLDITTYTAGFYELMVVVTKTDGTTKFGTCTVQIIRNVTAAPGV